MRRLILCLLAVAGCESVPSSALDGATLPDAVTASPDLAESLDLEPSPDLTTPPGPAPLSLLYFASPPSPDVVAMYRVDAAGSFGVTLQAYGADMTKLADILHFESEVVAKGQAWAPDSAAYPSQLVVVRSVPDADHDVVWWRALGAGNYVAVPHVSASVPIPLAVSDDGLYIAIDDGLTLRAGPRDALATLPAACHAPKFSPVTNHLYFVCGADLYRLGKDQPVASIVRIAPGATQVAFTKDGLHVIVLAPPPAQVLPRLIVATTDLSALDDIVTQGAVSSVVEDLVFETVIAVPTRTLVEYVAGSGGTYALHQLDWSTGTVSTRAEVNVGTEPQYFRMWTSAAWIVYAVGNIGQFADPVDGGAVVSRTAIGWFVDTLPSATFALGGGMSSSQAWDVYGPDLVKRYSCFSIVEVGPARGHVLIDDDRSFVRAVTPAGLALAICSASGTELLSVPGGYEHYLYERTTKRLFYTHDNQLSALAL